jgi:hypothetical protein
MCYTYKCNTRLTEAHGDEAPFRTMQQTILFSLKEAKQAYAAGKFDYMERRFEELGNEERAGWAKSAHGIGEAWRHV